jgi:hypothetical protein
MSRFVASLVVMLAATAMLQAADYRIEWTIGKGDPQGSHAAGTQKVVTAPELFMKSGEDATVLVGGHVKIGESMVPVGQELEVIATKADGGAVKVRAVFRLHSVVGNGAARQVTTVREETTATIQPGGTVRVEIGKDPKDRRWAEVTVRTHK